MEDLSGHNCEGVIFIEKDSGLMKLPTFNFLGIKQYKCMVILRELPCNAVDGSEILLTSSGW